MGRLLDGCCGENITPVLTAVCSARAKASPRAFSACLSSIRLDLCFFLRNVDARLRHEHNLLRAVLELELAIEIDRLRGALLAFRASQQRISFRWISAEAVSSRNRKHCNQHRYRCL